MSNELLKKIERNLGILPEAIMKDIKEYGSAEFKRGHWEGLTGWRCSCRKQDKEFDVNDPSNEWVRFNEKRPVSGAKINVSHHGIGSVVAEYEENTLQISPFEIHVEMMLRWKGYSAQILPDNIHQFLWCEIKDNG